MRLCDKRYYSLGRLSSASLFLVNYRLKQFMRDYDVEYPLDCFELIQKIKSSGKIDLGIETTDQLSRSFEATAVYLPEIEGYLIIMKPAPANWKQNSSWRRCNFTLAHELGHIFCGHLTIPKHLKSKEQQRLEDDEADEFAGRLLMPEGMILRSHFPAQTDLSAAFLVSDQALYKRLNNLQRLDLFHAPAPMTCPVCGNDQISPIADYCEICGTYLPDAGKNGVRVVEYTRTMAMPDDRVIFCPVCGNEEYSPSARFCRICGTPAYNYCGNTDDFVDCSHINAPNARFCEKCGSKTVFAMKGILQKWQNEREEYIRAITQE